MKIFFVALLFFMIGGCVSVLPDAPPASARYFITDINRTSTDRAPVAWTLSIEDPSATRALDTTKIAVSRTSGKIEYYSGGEWSDRAPRLFGSALVRSFENSGQILGVGSRVSLPLSDFILQTDIRDLHTVRSGKDVVVTTTVYARLTDGRSTIYAAQLFSKQSVLADEVSERVAQRIDNNVAEIMSDIIDWTFQEGSAAYAK